MPSAKINKVEALANHFRVTDQVKMKVKSGLKEQLKKKKQQQVEVEETVLSCSTSRENQSGVEIWWTSILPLASGHLMAPKHFYQAMFTKIQRSNSNSEKKKFGFRMETSNQEVRGCIIMQQEAMGL